MTRPIPAIVEKTFDVERSFSLISVSLAGERDAEKTAQRHEKLGAAARETAALRRLETGRELLRVRGAWPKHGPGSGGWTDFLKRLKIDDSTALRYMEAARTGKTHGEPPKPGNPPHGQSVSGIAEAPSVTAALALIAQLAPSERATIQRSLRSSMASENTGDRDSYCTPDHVTVALPDIDLDPCSNDNSSVRASTSYRLEAGQDGLVLPWFGLVYCNPPYSSPLPWAEKLDAERLNVTGCGFLVNADHSPAWWHALKQHLTIRIDFNERLDFKPPRGVVASKNDRPQTLLMDAAFWAECDQPALLAMGTLWRQDAALHLVK